MSKLPIILEDYLDYMETIKGTSPNTVKEYSYDLVTFFRFIKFRQGLADPNLIFEEIPILDINYDLISKVKLQDLHSYISYVSRKRNNGISAKSRKVASLRSYFDYLYSKINVIEKNPAEGLEFPKSESRHPVYLTLDECKLFLNSILENKNEEYRNRDYAIIILFLNCGLRLSELASINIDSIRENDRLTVIGKGNKERTIFLNDACTTAISDYIKVRPKNSKDLKALFISKQKNRMSNRAIQHMIDRYFEKAGFDTSVYSAHKLRHTAATLMYKYGNVDILALQEILGHESVSTTQIYTHIDDERLKSAIRSNPLGELKKYT